jgi:hypothetical protein
MSDLINKTLQVMESNETSNIFTEAASTPSLGKLAADHYHQHSLHAYGDHAGRTNAQIKVHGSNAEKIHSKIATHHGKETADAVAKHSDDAATVENATMGHVDTHFHSKFVQKHLGGNGSKEHQEYKKRITHHGDDEIAAHQTEKDWNEHA